MIAPEQLEIGSTHVQWNPAQFSPVLGKPGVEALPKFAPGMLDHQLGTVIPFCWPCGTPLGQAEIIGYLCAEDGSGVWLKFRIVSLEGAPHEHS
jgi:hypothetical protein